jgi:hypothetical protein
MLPDPRDEIGRYACVDRPVLAVGHDVDGGLLPHEQRRCEERSDEAIHLPPL